MIFIALPSKQYSDMKIIDKFYQLHIIIIIIMSKEGNM